MKILALLLTSTAIGLSAAPKANFTYVEDLATTPLLNPDFSERKTAKIVLDNGLQAYLISDPHVEQSAASLTVEAGSWNDPEDYAGMAHFCEHMLFLGTEMFSNENDFDAHIYNNAGLFNAFTAYDRTAYLFSINHDAFDEGLLRFSRFFIDPLFKENCIGRELKAVDQEHSKNIENDDRREMMIFKETGNPQHPNRGFATGNASTLGQIPREALVNWYKAHYSAKHMHLVVLSNLPIERLIESTVNYFSPVPNSEKDLEKYNLAVTSEKQRGHKLYIEPIKTERKLTLLWELPSSFWNLQGKAAAEVLCDLLKNEGETSLYQLLKKEELIYNINSGYSLWGNNNLLFEIDLDLTEKGLQNHEKAIALCFQALSSLKESSNLEHLASELAQIKKLHYQYQGREKVFNQAMQFAYTIPDEPLESYPEQTLFKLSYDENLTQSFLLALKPQDCIQIIRANPKEINTKLDKQEKWMGTAYALKEMSKERCMDLENSLPHKDIALPNVNPYIPIDLSLRNQTDNSVKQLVDAKGESVYYAFDQRYHLPEAILFFHFQSPAIDSSAKSATLIDLLSLTIDEGLSEQIFNARKAGIEHQLSFANLKLNLVIEGYNDKLSLYTKEFFSHLKTLTPSKESFALHKQMLLDQYHNSSHEMPVTQASQQFSSILFNDNFASDEKYSALATLSYEEYLNFTRQLLKELTVEALFYGNLSEEEAKELYSNVKSTLEFTPIAFQEQNKQMLLLPEKQGPFYLHRLTERSGNAVILAVQQGAFSFEKRAAQQVLASILKNQFTETLRTKQQIAYIAQSWDREEAGQLAQFFALQSSSHQPTEILARFELFIEDFANNIEEHLSKEEFETVQKALITRLKTPPENLGTMGSLLDKFAFEYNDFNWLEKRTASLENLNYEQTLSYAKQFFSRTNQKRLAILMEGSYDPQRDFRYEEVSKEDLHDLGTFVAWK